jgi:hypothetical protein
MSSAGNRLLFANARSQPPLGPFRKRKQETEHAKNETPPKNNTIRTGNSGAPQPPNDGKNSISRMRI